MKNRQMGQTKNRQQKSTETLLKKAGKIVAPLLIAGIMAMPGKADAGESKPAKATVTGASVVSGKIAKCRGVLGEGILLAPKGKCEMKVKKGDFVYKVEFVAEKAGYFGLRVADVDKRGVVFQMNMEAFMSESKGAFRVNFDGTNTMPKTEVFMSEHRVFPLRVQRTQDPNVAKVTWGR